jgi:hypothetical protein
MAAHAQQQHSQRNNPNFSHLLHLCESSGLDAHRQAGIAIGRGKKIAQLLAGNRCLYQ